MDILYIVMPVYNEADNIGGVIESWYPLLEGKDEKSRLLVADSGSTDKSHDILQKLAMKYPKLEILTDTDKEHGPKVIALYDLSIRRGADYIFQTDSDGQTNPEEFYQFWELRECYDAIFGNRLSREDGVFRAFVERVLCKIIYIYFGINVPDANAPFRLMKAETVKKYLSKLPKDYNLPNVMIVVYFVYNREKTKFLNVTFRSRRGGRSSVDFYKVLKIGQKAIYDFSVFKKGIKG